MLRPHCTLGGLGCVYEDVNLPTGSGLSNAKGTSMSDGEANSKPPKRHPVASAPLVDRLSMPGSSPQGVHEMVCGEPIPLQAHRFQAFTLRRNTRKKKTFSGPPAICVSRRLQKRIDSFSWARQIQPDALESSDSGPGEATDRCKYTDQSSGTARIYSSRPWFM